MNLHDDAGKVFERRREPSYGATAARYNALAKLGARVLEILDREWDAGEQGAPARDYAAIRQSARFLGLLAPEARRG